jgi:hypothetical protein
MSAEVVPASGKDHRTISADRGTTRDEPTKEVLDFLAEMGKRRYDRCSMTGLLGAS